MSRIFLSHSSADELEAVALNQWLIDNGWDDVFLDINPERGLAAGERWQEALRRAADRCEAVVFIITPAWAKSKWCLTEFLLAKSLHKLIFGAVLKPVEITDLPTELTSEWQLCHLVGDGPKALITFTHRGEERQINFMAEGLTRLRVGLQNAGLDASHFPWPPKNEPDRSPYRGLSPLEHEDAAIYFGRDAQIVRGLDVLRGMRDKGVETLFVVLGPSGTGKSSFLRAGLLPRLKRDDRHFLPLEPIRPERHPVTGERGLAVAIHKARLDLSLAGLSLGDVKATLAKTANDLPTLFSDIQLAAHQRLLGQAKDFPLPTLVLAVDQAEELFNPDATDEAHRFLALIGETLRNMPRGHASLIVAFTIRSDRYEPLQTAPELSGLKSRVFDDLKPMPPTQFKEVITGPARRATVAGIKLDIKPDLVESLLNQCAEGADTLPLLALTLARLYRDYGSDGDLRLDEYEAMGGMQSVVNDEVASILSPDPLQRQAELDQLRAAFIPWLATINPKNDEPFRLTAPLEKLPPESHRLIHALIDKHLLSSDLRGDTTVVEVAHESLLRQWLQLAIWLGEQREDLKAADVLERAVQDWDKNDHNDAWLIEGERLAQAEALTRKPIFERKLVLAEKFLEASRQKQDALQAEEKRRREEDLIRAQEQAAAETKRANEEAKAKTQAENERKRLSIIRWELFLVIFVLLVVLGAASYLYFQEKKAKNTAKAAEQSSLVMKRVAEAQTMLAGDRAGSDEQAMLQLLADFKINKKTNPELLAEIQSALSNAVQNYRLMKLIISMESEVNSLAKNPDSNKIIAGDAEGNIFTWDSSTGRPIKSAKASQDGVGSAALSQNNQAIMSLSWDKKISRWDATGNAIDLGKPLGSDSRLKAAAFSEDGKTIAMAGWDKKLGLWNAETKMRIGDEVEKHTGFINTVVFDKRGNYVVSGSDDFDLLIWNVSPFHTIGQSFTGHRGNVNSVAFSPDGSMIVSGSEDNTLRIWKTRRDNKTIDPLIGHTGAVTAVAYSQNGKFIVSGSDDKTLRIWDGSSGRALGEPLNGHKGKVTHVTIAKELDNNSLEIFSASRDKTIRRWLVRDTDISIRASRRAESLSGKEIFIGQNKMIVRGEKNKYAMELVLPNSQGIILEGHSDNVTGVTLSTDGKYIASVSNDKTLRFWNATSGQPIGSPIRIERGHPTGVKFSTDQRRVEVAIKDKDQSMIWPAPVAWPDELCSKLTRNMSRKQWNEWVSPSIAYECQCPGLPIAPDDPKSTAKPEMCPGKPAVSMFP